MSTDLFKSQCKCKILHLPTANYIVWMSEDGHNTIYPVESTGYNYKKWVDRTLVRGCGEYIPYSEWVLMNVLFASKRKHIISNIIKEHFIVEWD